MKTLLHITVSVCFVYALVSIATRLTARFTSKQREIPPGAFLLFAAALILGLQALTTLWGPG